jgi:hypothetical protein
MKLDLFGVRGPRVSPPKKTKTAAALDRDTKDTLPLKINQSRWNPCSLYFLF